jgi:hypothetical protein
LSHFLEISKLIADVAPTLSTAFLGPYAGIALSLVSKAIGAAAHPEAVKTALTANPESWTQALQDLEQSHGGWLSMLTAMKPPSKITFHIEVEFPTA